MSAPLAALADPDSRGPFRLAVALVALTVVVILIGAMVTSTASGMAFTDWPLSDGQWLPERSLTTLAGFLEHFHRLAAALAGVLSLLLTVWVLRRPGVEPAVRRSVLIGLLLIIAQGVLGGVGVLLNLPVLTSALHGTLAQVTISVFAVTGYLLSARARATPTQVHPAAGAARKLAMIALAALILQTVIGAIARHSAGPGSAHALWTHVGNAFIVFLLILIAAGFASSRLAHVPGLRGIGRTLLLLLVLQVVLGFVALLVRRGKHPENIEHLWRASLISSHVLVGALLTLFASLLAAHVFRGCRRA